MARRTDAIGSLRFSPHPNLRGLLDSGLQSPPFCAQPSVSVMIAVFLAALEYCIGNHIFQVASYRLPESVGFNEVKTSAPGQS